MSCGKNPDRRRLPAGRERRLQLELLRPGRLLQHAPARGPACRARSRAASGPARRSRRRAAADAPASARPRRRRPAATTGPATAPAAAASTSAGTQCAAATCTGGDLHAAPALQRHGDLRRRDDRALRGVTPATRPTGSASRAAPRTRTAWRPTSATPASARSSARGGLHLGGRVQLRLLRAGVLLRSGLHRALQVVRARGQQGTCSNVANGTAPTPASQCAATAATTCGTDGMCDGRAPAATGDRHALRGGDLRRVDADAAAHLRRRRRLPDGHHALCDPFSARQRHRLQDDLRHRRRRTAWPRTAASA